jgi:hypothetical protein
LFVCLFVCLVVDPAQVFHTKTCFADLLVDIPAAHIDSQLIDSGEGEELPSHSFIQQTGVTVTL